MSWLRYELTATQIYVACLLVGHTKQSVMIDHCVASLDGCGSFHGMGLIEVSTVLDSNQPGMQQQTVTCLQWMKSKDSIWSSGLPFKEYFSPEHGPLSRSACVHYDRSWNQVDYSSHVNWICCGHVGWIFIMLMYVILVGQILCKMLQMTETEACLKSCCCPLLTWWFLQTHWFPHADELNLAVSVKLWHDYDWRTYWNSIMVQTL